jgi:hypothetical protein
VKRGRIWGKIQRVVSKGEDMGKNTKGSIQGGGENATRWRRERTQLRKILGKGGSLLLGVLVKM